MTSGACCARSNAGSKPSEAPDRRSLRPKWRRENKGDLPVGFTGTNYCTGMPEASLMRVTFLSQSSQLELQMRAKCMRVIPIGAGTGGLKEIKEAQLGVLVQSEAQAQRDEAILVVLMTVEI